MQHVRSAAATAGAIGLDLGYTDEQGPCLIKDVPVDGFEVGVSTRTAVDSVTIENRTCRPAAVRAEERRAVHQR